MKAAIVHELLSDTTKAKEMFGWEKKISFDVLVMEMVREDLKAAERDEFVKNVWLLCERLSRADRNETLLWILGRAGNFMMAVL